VGRVFTGIEHKLESLSRANRNILTRCGIISTYLVHGNCSSNSILVWGRWSKGVIDMLDRKATVKMVNQCLRALGITTDELEFVRGRGYAYVFGTLVDSVPEQGMYGAGPYINRHTVRVWLRHILYILETSRDDSERLSLVKDMLAIAQRL